MIRYKWLFSVLVGCTASVFILGFNLILSTYCGMEPPSVEIIPLVGKAIIGTFVFRGILYLQQKKKD